MPKTRFVLLRLHEQLQFIEMPSTHAYQLTALNRRLHKEINKLTVSDKPPLPYAIAEFDELDLTDEQYHTTSGLDYINQLERSFSALNEPAYPLISLLTEIRALQAQLEQWYEEEYE